jgi:hypothetical protein
VKSEEFLKSQEENGIQQQISCLYHPANPVHIILITNKTEDNDTNIPPLPLKIIITEETIV